MRGVFFIITEKPDHDTNYATWSQIKEMADGGQEIGSHTDSHPDLAKVSDAKMIFELLNSKKEIEKRIENTVISLCYPSGKYNARVLKATAANYLFARTTRFGKYFDLAKRFEISSIRILPRMNTIFLKFWFNDRFYRQTH
mgnify:CR=1 FL=1